VRDWPPITEPELLERMALSDEEFVGFAATMARAWGRRDLDAATLQWALGYPWERPPASFVLRDGDVALLDDLDTGARDATIRTYTEGRHPIVSYGGNAAPSWLERKFAHFEDAADRTVLVLGGRLQDFDVGPAAALAPVGYMPATLFASPGTEVRASVVWATAAQVTQLTWSEVPYRLVRLDDARFVVDGAEAEIDTVFAYLHRLGVFCVDGAPVALAAVPAANRTARALTQPELLDIAAAMVLGEGARAGDLVHAIFDDMAAVVARSATTVWPRGRQMESGWTRFPLPARAQPG
jgi:hypothetical protein